jgi:L-2-hydroxyglutarate oxidase
MVDFLIIGGGIVGLATAHTIQTQTPSARVLVVEKESRVAQHQTGRNSGVIHSGVYYEPGSEKARFCRAGLQATIDFCNAERIAYAQCGKLIVATDELEHSRLRDLANRALKNDIEHYWVNDSELSVLEPHIRGVAALRIPTTGMVDYRAITERLHQLIVNRGGEVRLNTQVVSLRETLDGIEASTSDGTITAKQMVVCAGINGDRLAASAGVPLNFAMIPFRGDYFRLPPKYDDLVQHHIYPVPDPNLPFLGVHLTRLIHGGISVGPSAMLALHREGYAKTSFNWRDASAALFYPGTRRLLTRFARAGLTEFACAMSRRFYLRQVQKYCPTLTLDDLLPHPSGIRAQAVLRDGKMAHDFILHSTSRATYVCNAPSPAATSAFPIAGEIVKRLLNSGVS